MRRRHQRHPAGDDFRQNLDPLQIALAHRYQSHPQSPRSSNPGSVTFQLCRNRTLQLCGYKTLWRGSWNVRLCAK
ncbi:hypothetical protein ELH22_10990 [Rhizobium ruizarguesonis]|nr:hypothetical protein ELH22_10990 [Rhizobium ruizarguesonis]